MRLLVSLFFVFSIFSGVLFFTSAGVAQAAVVCLSGGESGSGQAPSCFETETAQECTTRSGRVDSNFTSCAQFNSQTPNAIVTCVNLTTDGSNPVCKDTLNAFQCEQQGGVVEDSSQITSCAQYRERFYTGVCYKVDSNEAPISGFCTANKTSATCTGSDYRLNTDISTCAELYSILPPVVDRTGVSICYQQSGNVPVVGTCEENVNAEACDAKGSNWTQDTTTGSCDQLYSNNGLQNGPALEPLHPPAPEPGLESLVGSAQSEKPLFSGDLKGEINELNRFQGKNLPQVIGTLVKTAMGVMGTLALVIFIYGGITWMLARGEADKQREGFDTLVWGSLGIAVMLASYALVNYVFEAFR